MKRKHLESALSSIKREFPSPNILLEQYPTSPTLAASVIITALDRGDIGPGRTALDLGCGTGMLAIACALVDCDHVLGLDCDEDALEVARTNINEMEIEDQISLIMAKVNGIPGVSSSLDDPVAAKQRRQHHQSRGGRGRGRGGSRGRGQGRQGRASTAEARDIILTDNDGIPLRTDCVDTVITNPPFGTKNNAGMDLRFLRTATRLARIAVYSFHKSSTRDFLVRKVQEWGMEITVVAQMRFELPQTYKFHREKNVDIEVDLIRVSVAKLNEPDI